MGKLKNVREDAHEEGWEKGLEQGIEQGIEQGEDKHLITLICKKLCKGKDVEQIADEVEEDGDRVKKICDLAERFAPDYDPDKVFEALRKEMPDA